MRIPHFVFCFLLALSAQAQLGDLWYFGEGAGIDFRPLWVSSTDPLLLSDGETNHLEGTATVSADCGELLFYTDGVTVWNREHDIMENGVGLQGSFTSTTSAVIVPVPGDPLRYYIFTAPAFGTGQYLWSEVDLSLDDGLGEVTEKNQIIWGPASEKLAVTRHANGRDWWVVGHSATGDTYVSFPVTESGVGAFVLSAAGTAFSSGQSAGVLRFNGAGDQLACAMVSPSQLELLAFDKSTGTVANAIDLGGTLDAVYGVEFSADDSKLYYSDQSFEKLWQFDLSGYPSAVAINASKTEIFQSVGLPDYGQLALGPDGQIYLSRDLGNFSVILDPNESGLACNYVHDTLSFFPAVGQIGMSHNPREYLEGIRLGDCSVCPDRPLEFMLQTFENPDSVQWNFGEPASGADNSSDFLNPSHSYLADGWYRARVSWWKDGVMDSDRVSIEVLGPPEIDLSPGDTIYTDVVIELNATTPDATYEWSDGSTDPIIVVSESGLYSVTVTFEGGCTQTDSVYVNFTTGHQDWEESSSRLKVWPNPAASGESILVRMPDIRKPVIGLHHAQGQEYLIEDMLWIEVGDGIAHIRLPDLVAGAYWIQVRDLETGNHGGRILIVH